MQITHKHTDPKLCDLTLHASLVESVIISFYQQHVTGEVFIVGSLKIDSGKETLTSRIGSDVLTEY